MKSCVVMVGDGLDTAGGISSVIRTYRDGGFFAEKNVVFVSNYEGPGLLRQLRVTARGLLAFVSSFFSWRVELVHIHSASRGSFWRAAVIAGFSRLFACPYVIHVHSGEFLVFFENECGSFAQAVVARVFEGAESVICVAPSWCNAFRKIAPKASFDAVSNPVFVPVDVPEAISTPSLQLLFLGRLNEKKGLVDLFWAMKEVLAVFPDSKLVIAGDGQLDAMQQLVRGIGIGHSVIFKGWVSGDEKDRCLREASVVVLPSHFEAFGVSVLEAMAYGKPVVATRVGGIPEIMVHEKHGYLVAPHDPVALGAALVSLLAAPDKCEHMGEAAFCHVKANFSVDRVLALLASDYDRWKRVQ